MTNDLKSVTHWPWSDRTRAHICDDSSNLACSAVMYGALTPIPDTHACFGERIIHTTQGNGSLDRNIPLYSPEKINSTVMERCGRNSGSPAWLRWQQQKAAPLRSWQSQHRHVTREPVTDNSTFSLVGFCSEFPFWRPQLKFSEESDQLL
ncbi:hypothetical protein AOLI_G00168580 [Acnodon oligacanthus]